MLLMEDPRIRIYYDGVCRLCSGLIDRIEHSREADSFEPIAIQKEVPAGMPYAEADRDMHAVDAEGRVYKGADAVRYIMSRYPRWRWLASLASLPGLKQLANLLYRLIADNRKRWFYPHDAH
jgi:predicted DCC family thiol-disulfide oxidoreductase YuxK